MCACTECSASTPYLVADLGTGLLQEPSGLNVPYRGLCGLYTIVEIVLRYVMWSQMYGYCCKACFDPLVDFDPSVDKHNTTLHRMKEARE